MAFGSVPLKTYLPDGDIDLSLFQAAGPSIQATWTDRLAAALEAEATRKRGPFRVRDVQVINAEVNLVKCLVDDTVVDISLQTLGGLCTVLFLESIDQHIQGDHIFKRSIILVRTVCGLFATCAKRCACAPQAASLCVVLGQGMVLLRKQAAGSPPRPHLHLCPRSARALHLQLLQRRLHEPTAGMYSWGSH